MPVLSAEGREVSENHWVICALVRDGKIQIEDRLEPDKPMFGYKIVPGGKIEPSETIEEACIRETRKEYGVTPTNYKKIGIVFDTSVTTGSLDFRHVFLITEWKGWLKNREERNKHLSLSLEEAKRLCKHKTSQEILDLIESVLP